MPDLLEISFHHKNHFVCIHFHFIDSDSMLNVFAECLHFMCKRPLFEEYTVPNPTAILAGTL